MTICIVKNVTLAKRLHIIVLVFFLLQFLLLLVHFHDSGKCCFQLQQAAVLNKKASLKRLYLTCAAPTSRRSQQLAGGKAFSSKTA